MLTATQSQMQSPSIQHTPNPAPRTTPRSESNQLPAATSRATFAPDSLPLPDSSGIPAATVKYAVLAKHFRISDQQSFLGQHDELTVAMSRLQNQQPSFKAFVQDQLEKAFPDVRPLNAETISFNRYRDSDGVEILASSEPLMNALSRMIQEIQANPNKLLTEKHNTRSEFITRQTPQSSTVEALTSGTLQSIARTIATQYPATLQTFWTSPRSMEGNPQVLEAPQNQLLNLHKQQLSTLAALRAQDGTLSPASKQLIDSALQYPTLAAREKAFADGARPGMYPITLDDGSERGALLAGAFLITQTDGSFATAPTWPKGRSLALNDANGPVVLYTPGEGFEEFATPALARQALAQRLDEGGINADLLLQTLPLSLQNRAEPPAGEDLMHSTQPLDGDVLAEGVPWMLKRQQEETYEGLTKIDLQSPASMQAIDNAADWSYLLDGSNALQARNTKLAEKLQPEWLKNLSPTQEAFFDQLEQKEEKSTLVLTPLLEKIPSLATFARDKINEAIKKLYPTAEIDADQLKVQWRTKTRIHSGRTGNSNPTYEKNTQLSLTDLALKNPTEFQLGSGYSHTQETLKLSLTDKQGKPIHDTEGKPVVLGTDQLKALVNTADVGGEYTRLLKTELATEATSGAAGERRSAWKANLADGLNKAAFLATLNPDAYTAEARDDKSSKRGAQWVAAVLNHSDPTDRPQVDGETIVTHTIVQHGLPVQGVMVIGNGRDPEKVLYTPDAPDGIAFREVASQAALNTLLEKKEWRLYTANRKSPVSKDDVAKATAALKKQASELTSPANVIDTFVKALKLTGDRSTLQPLSGNVQDALYQQHVQLVTDKADHQSVSSAEVAAQSTANKVQFAIEVASIFLDLIPVVGKGISAAARLGKSAVTALRANARLLPKLIKNPALGRAIYADFSTSASGIPLIRTSPLRPVVKVPVAAIEPATRATPRSLQVVDSPPPIIASTSTGVIPAGTRTGPATIGINRDLSAYTVPDEVIRGAVLGSNGTYNVGGNWYVRFTDSTGVNKTYQIESAFHANSGRVNIIDPNLPASTSRSAKRQATLQSAGNGEWRLANNVGGGRSQPKARGPLTNSVMPTASSNQQLLNHPDWQSAVNSGMHNGQPVFIHYTTKEGAEAIAREHSINDLARGDRRAGSKGGVYVNPPGQQFNAENVETLLFLGNERYVGSGNYMVIFSADQVPANLGPVTAGSQFVELKMQKAIKLTPSNFLYSGPNTFPDYFG